jgi:Tfp pilus assembly protein PilV
VETLVAMGVFAIGISALMPLVVGTVRANESAAVRSRGVALAQAKIEDFRALPYDDVVNLAAGNEVLPGGYTRRWEAIAAPAVAGDGNDLRRLLVTVSWNLPGRGAGSAALVASRARY